jgi:hypothetical protein
VKLKMLVLDGAQDVRRQLLSKWGFKIKRRDKFGSYLVEFPCPECHQYCAYEDFRETQDEWFGHCWLVYWSSKCGHVEGQVTYVAEPGEIAVQENGKIVAAIVPYLRPGALWQRLDFQHSGKSRVVRFGTIWQALKASVFECQLFAMMQDGDESYG